MPHVRRERVTRHEAVHVTLKRAPGLPSLRRPRAFALIARIFRAEKADKGFRLVHFAVRPDHLHLVCEADHTLALSRGVQRIAARLGRGLNALFARRGRLLADRFHARVIRTPRQMRNTLRYVLLNAHKDARRAGAAPPSGVDPYSSGPWFDGWRGAPRGARPSVAARAAPPVTAPRSWLLGAGWRRGGLLDWRDVPG